MPCLRSCSSVSYCSTFLRVFPKELEDQKRQITDADCYVNIYAWLWVCDYHQWSAKAASAGIQTRTDAAVELSCDSALQARSAANEHVFNADKSSNEHTYHGLHGLTMPGIMWRALKIYNIIWQYPTGLCWIYNTCFKPAPILSHVLYSINDKIGSDIKGPNCVAGFDSK